MWEKNWQAVCWMNDVWLEVAIGLIVRVHSQSSIGVLHLAVLIFGDHWTKDPIRLPLNNVVVVLTLPRLLFAQVGGDDQRSLDQAIPTGMVKGKEILSTDVLKAIVAISHLLAYRSHAFEVIHRSTGL